MCGFAGFIGPPDRELLIKMGERVLHRGPDQHGERVSDECSMTHKRLAIIDLSEAGRQPMITTDGRFTIVYNGELYNYRELRRRYESQGWKFQTQTDTECFLASAALHGLRDLQDFHGMFAFVIWDCDLRRAYAARDRMGIKPLFIATVGERTVFASEIGAVLEARPSWKVDAEARAMFLSVGYVSGLRTIFHGLRSLPPGHLYLCTAKGESMIADFDDRVASVRYPSFDKARQELPAIVDRAVSDQLVSDRPVGVFLSGGLDSSVVLSAMRKAQPSAQIKTFTTRFRHNVSDPKFNRDAELACQTAARYGCEHFEIEVGPEDFMREAEAMALHLGQPHNNHSVVALDAAARLASQHVPVVLSGDGGDESFGGYERYRLYRRWALVFKSPTLRKILSFLPLYPRTSDVRDWLAENTDIGRMLMFHTPRFHIRKGLFGEAATDEAVIQNWSKQIDDFVGHDPVRFFMSLDRATWLCDDAFVRSDRLTMRHGLELRVPLTDDAIVSFAASLPSAHHVTGGETKRLWRAAFADRCLPEVLHEKKRGWFPPTAKWLRGGLKEWARTIIEEALQSHAWMNGPSIRQAFDDHLSHRAYRLNELWTVIGYQLWWRNYETRLHR